MKSLIVRYSILALAPAFSLLVRPAFAHSGHGADISHIENGGVNNLFNIIISLGSLAFVGAGIWILRTNMKRKPEDHI